MVSVCVSRRTLEISAKQTQWIQEVMTTAAQAPGLRSAAGEGSVMMDFVFVISEKTHKSVTLGAFVNAAILTAHITMAGYVEARGSVNVDSAFVTRAGLVKNAAVH